MRKRSQNRSDTYFDLVKRRPMRSIQNASERDAAQAIVDELLRQKLDDGGLAYLDALSDLVILYEREQHALTPLSPHDLLTYTLDERGLSQADLARQPASPKPLSATWRTANAP